MPESPMNDAVAQRKGFDDFQRSRKGGDTSAFGRSDYDPPDDFAAAYDLGWHEAAAKYDATYFQREHRGTCIVRICVGVLFLGAGSAVSFGSILGGGNVVVVAYGAMVTGLVLIGGGAYGLIAGRPPSESGPSSGAAA